MKYVLDSSALDRGEPRTSAAARYLGADGQPVLTKFCGRGLWGVSAVPHHGWDYYDGKNPFMYVAGDSLPNEPGANADGEPTFRVDGTPFILHDGYVVPRCEMCEAQSIVWIHRLQHPDVPYVLDCGKTCAGHMIGNLAKAVQREADAKAAHRIEKLFRNGAEWHGNARQQQAIVGMLWLTIKWNERPGPLGGYTARIWHKPSNYGENLPLTYPSIPAAKDAAILAAVEARRTKPWKQHEREDRRQREERQFHAFSDRQYYEDGAREHYEDWSNYP